MCRLNTENNCQLLRHVQGFPLRRLLWADLTSKGSSLALLFVKLLYHYPCGTPLDLSSSQYIYLYMPRLENSADSLQPNQYGCFAWTSVALQTSSVRSNIYRSDTSTSAPNSADSLQPNQYGCFAWTSVALQTSSVRSNIYRSDTSTSAPR